MNVYKDLSYYESQELANNADKNPTLNSDDKARFNKTYKSDGFTIHYSTSSERDAADNTVSIYDTWRYSEDELREFLTDLQTQYSSINVEKVLNECIWHNVLYSKGIFVSHTKDADVYFNKNDDWFWWIFETLRFC